MGTQLRAEFIAATGGHMDAFASADRLAGYGGVAPAARDSGRISGNHHRPRRYHRGLLRVFYLSAMASLKSVLWAMMRDGACYQSAPSVATPAWQRHWGVLYAS